MNYMKLVILLIKKCHRLDTTVQTEVIYDDVYSVSSKAS